MILHRKKGHNQYQNNPIDLEAILAVEITKTGKGEVRKRRKAGLSAYYIKDGRIIEQKPDKSVVSIRDVHSKWVTIEKHNRKVTLK